MLAALFAAQQASLEDAWKASLAVPDGPAQDGGVAAGEAAAAAMLATRENDGRNAPGRPQ